MHGNFRQYLNRLILILIGMIAFQSMSFCTPLPLFASSDRPELIRIGYVTHELSPNSANGNNEHGYSYDYLHEISQYYNWELEFIPVKAKDSVRMLSEGSVDLLSHVHYNKDIENLIDYSSKESGICRVGLYILNKNQGLATDDLRSFSGKRIGRFAPQKHIEMLERSVNSVGIKVTYVDFENNEPLIEALTNGLVDGALISGNNIPSGLKIIKAFPEEPFYFAVAEGNKELLSKVDIAMQNIMLMAPSFKNDLFKKHYGRNLAWESILTVEEKQFIERSPELIVSYDPIWRPFEYYDKVKKEMAGINAEILQLVKEYTGLRIRISHSPTWAEALRKMRDGEIDILTGVNRSFIWGAKNNFMVTQPLLNAPIVMVLNRGHAYTGERVALPKDYFLSEVVESFHKFDDTVYLISQEECFEALVHNKVSATFANSYVANYLISLPRYSNLYIINYGNLNEEVAFGISKRCDPILVSIINKAFNSIPEETVNGIIIKHSYSKEKVSLIDIIYEHHVDVAKALTAILVICVIALVLINITKSQDKKNLKKLLYYDSLTGHKNYASFTKDVPEIIKKNPGTNFAVVFIDIVEFKFINNSFGYEEGDKVLINVAETLESIIDRSREIFARITGDHFVVLLNYEKFK